MFGLGMGELIVIFLIVFILFGPKALPQVAKGIAQAIQTFKKETNALSKGIHEEVNKENWEHSSDSDSPQQKPDWQKETNTENKN